jgi:hypothetical protein
MSDDSSSAGEHEFTSIYNMSNAPSLPSSERRTSESIAFSPKQIASRKRSVSRTMSPRIRSPTKNSTPLTSAKTKRGIAHVRRSSENNLMMNPPPLLPPELRAWTDNIVAPKQKTPISRKKKLSLATDEQKSSRRTLAPVPQAARKGSIHMHERQRSLPSTSTFTALQHLSLDLHTSPTAGPSSSVTASKTGSGNRLGLRSLPNLDASDDEDSTSIHDLNNAPEPRSKDPQPSMLIRGDSLKSLGSDHSGNNSRTRMNFRRKSSTSRGNNKLSPGVDVSEHEDGSSQSSDDGDSFNAEGLAVQLSRSFSEPRNRTESNTWSDDHSDGFPYMEDDEDSVNNDTATIENRRPPVILYGKQLPQCFSRLPTINTVASKVVTYCFCGIRFKQSTDRAILGRLNVLIAIWTVFPLAASIFLGVMLYVPYIVDRTIPYQINTAPQPPTQVWTNFWNLNRAMMMLGAFSLVSFITSVLTWRVVRDVDLIGAGKFS